MEIASIIGGGRVGYVLIVGLLVWVSFTFMDLLVADFSHQKPFPVRSRQYSAERHLLHKEENDVKEEQSTVSEFSQWWTKQKELKERIANTCQKYGASLRVKVKRAELLYDPKHDLLFCRNAKVGTTTWLTHFLRLSNLSEAEKNSTIFSSPKLHKNIPPLFPVPDDVDLRVLAKSSTSFSMVRHPFERLVSAFQDKMVDGTDPSYFNVRNYIIEKYGDVTFPNFVNMILHKSISKCRTLNSCRIDKHWRPFISRCGYCDLPYRVIAKAENFQDDQRFIGDLAGVQLDKVETHHSSGGSTRQLSKEYFSMLDTHTVNRLYKLYKVDFEMFGYSPDLYYQYASPVP